MFSLWQRRVRTESINVLAAQLWTQKQALAPETITEGKRREQSRAHTNMSNDNQLLAPNFYKYTFTHANKHAHTEETGIGRR